MEGFHEGLPLINKLQIDDSPQVESSSSLDQPQLDPSRPYQLDHLDEDSRFPQLYRPLDSTRHEIRLFRIRPSPQKDSTIQCEIETANLDAQPEYQALSYEWKPPNITDLSVKVLLNGQEITATANLLHALTCLRQRPPLWYWVDALCINQSDNHERVHQVQMMKRIYEQASQVIIWLGPNHHNISMGMDLIEALASEASQITNVGAEQRLFEEKLTDSSLTLQWEGVRQLFKNSYWSRLWIVQEVFLASSASLMCGFNSIPFEHISVIVSALIHDPIRPGIVSRAHQLIQSGSRMLQIAFFRWRWRVPVGRTQPYIPPGSKSLLHNLIKFHYQSCQSPRDRVYAVLGISDQPSGVEFPISYTEPVSTTFHNVAKFIIEGSQDLSVLLECQLQMDQPRIRPSWAPDWEHYLSNYRPIIISENTWDACFPLSGKDSFRINDKVLKSKGFMIGSISRTSKLFSVSDPEVAASSFRDWLIFVLKGFQIPAEPGADKQVSQADFSTIHEISTSTVRKDSSEPLQANIWETVLEALYDALVRTALVENLYSTTCPFSNFREYCNKIRDTDKPLANSEWPFLDPWDPTKFSIHYNKLCSIEISPTHNMDISKGDGEAFESTRSRTVAFASRYAKEGDVLAVVRGCKYPLVLRREEYGYMVVNHAYVYGFREERL